MLLGFERIAVGFQRGPGKLQITHPKTKRRGAPAKFRRLGRNSVERNRVKKKNSYKSKEYMRQRNLN
jgi:hypothetical protein